MGNKNQHKNLYSRQQGQDIQHIMKDMIPSTTDAIVRINLRVNRHSNGTAIKKEKEIFKSFKNHFPNFNPYLNCNHSMKTDYSQYF